MNLFQKTTSVLTLTVVLAFACKQDPGRSTSATDSNIRKPGNQSLRLDAPVENSAFPIGQEIVISYSFRDSLKIADSVIYKLNGKKISKNIHPDKPITWNTNNELPGIKNLTLTAYYPDSTIESRHVKIKLVSDIKPEEYRVKVVATYPHDRTAYTQGLIFEDGILYESTGQTGQSTLRKVKLETGERLKVLNLPPDLFAEGLATVGNYLYQITYKNNIAFQYDKNTFELVNKFHFPMKEGWGLTYDGKYLLMTDGSEIIYFLDPEYFTEVKHIAVYDDHGPVTNLNELEYINGEIWANVFTTENIVRIEPSTGRVLSRITAKDLLKKEDYHTNIDYLNGIAYDKANDRIFITGKNWPKLFEIKLVK